MIESKICVCAMLDAAYECFKHGLPGSQGKMPILTYFLFIACFLAPNTLIYMQFFPRDCNIFAVDICSSTYEKMCGFSFQLKVKLIKVCF